MNRKRLYRRLYNACRNRVHPAVKALRDYECYKAFGKPYNELSDSELASLIDYVESKELCGRPAANQLTMFQ